MRYPTTLNPVLRGYLYLSDLCAALLARLPLRRNRIPVKSSMKRILFCNPAALGDVLYTLRLAATLKKNDPTIEIGMLVGGWARELVVLSPDVAWVHTMDHWVLARGRGSRLLKILRWIIERRRTLREIRNMRYEAAVDLYYYFPGHAFFFWQADIPQRVGYDAAGGGSLLTRMLHWECEDLHNVEYQAHLLRAMGYVTEGIERSRTDIRTTRSDSQTLELYGLSPQGYVVLHPGAGDPDREWAPEYWTLVAEDVRQHGYVLCFTGYGARDRASVDAITADLGGTWVDLCDRLPLADFFQIVRNAACLVGVESFAGHVAAMYDIRQVSVMHGATNRYQWQPYANPSARVIRRTLDCSPCYFKRLCRRHNACMEIPPAPVCAAVEELLPVRGEETKR